MKKIWSLVLGPPPHFRNASAIAGCNGIAIDAGGFGFALWAGQIGLSIARDLPPRLFTSNFEAELLGRSAAETGPAVPYTLWRNTASIIKACFFGLYFVIKLFCTKTKKFETLTVNLFAVKKCHSNVSTETFCQ